jgi:RNA recognition motif-containing protein
MRFANILKLLAKCKCRRKKGKKKASMGTDRNFFYSTQATVIRRSKLRSAGYGFVTYETSDEAEKAAETLDNTELDGRKISVQIARPKASKKTTTTPSTAEKPTPTKRRSITRPTTASNTRIFVANLPYATTDDELAALFSGFTIESASIARLRK